MPETANIAKMAEILSQELFAEFLWGHVGPCNWNWPCEEAENHNRKTHPSDAVFYYDEPYSVARTYVNCDLKSYAKNTISAGNVRAAIESLALALSCAEKSDDWRKKYIHDHVSPDICGLLFIYNHDGEYDKNFFDLLVKVQHDNLQIPKGSKIVVFGPKDIFWLDNVRHEIVQMRGKGELPERDHCQFFYPHLFLKKKIQLERAKAATLEMLTAPWIIMSYTHPKKQSRKGFVVFYKRRGESVQEFLYLIDYFMHYQVITSDIDIQLKTLDAHPDAPAFLGKAIGQYIDECNGSETDIKSRLEAIHYSQIAQVRTRFSELEIGMRNA